MNYLKIYKQLIEKRRFTDRLISYKDDPSQQYSERHHIIPRSLGGSDKKHNLVRLLPREHYIAHLLLWKIAYNLFGEHSVRYKQVLYAIQMMSLNNQSQLRYFTYNSRFYSIIKNKIHETGILTEEQCRKISERMKGSGNPMYGLFGPDNPGYGSKRTPEQRKKMSEAQKRYFSTHEVPKGEKHHSYGTTPIINRNTGQITSIKKSELDKYVYEGSEWESWHYKFSDETKKKMSESARNKIVTEEHKKNISIGVRKRNLENPELMQQISKSISKLIWIKNINLKLSERINPDRFGEDKEFKQSEGWERGRLNVSYLKNLIWVHKNDIEKRVKKSDLDNFLRDGYKLGFKKRKE